MKSILSISNSRLLAAGSLPAFLWVAQEPIPVWSSQPGSGLRRVQAVGTATGTGSANFLAWSSSGSVSMGGVSSTLVGDERLAVQVGSPGPEVA